MTTKVLRARELGVSRGTLYYREKKPDKDWELKVLIEEVLRLHPSYGSRRIALHLKLNRKSVSEARKEVGEDQEYQGTVPKSPHDHVPHIRRTHLGLRLHSRELERQSGVHCNDTRSLYTESGRSFRTHHARSAISAHCTHGSIAVPCTTTDLPFGQRERV